MKLITDDILLDEWTKTLDDLNTGSAAGPSSIDYRIIRKLSESMYNILINFINISFTGRMVSNRLSIGHQSDI